MAYRPLPQGGKRGGMIGGEKDGDTVIKISDHIAVKYDGV